MPLDLTGIAPASRLFALALDYRNPSVMYLTASSGIYRRVGASAWEFVHPLNAQALAVDFVDSNVLWAGVSWTTEYKAVILKSPDAGRTWGKADFGIQAYLGYGVTRILIDPVNPDILYANLRYGGLTSDNAHEPDSRNIAWAEALSLGTLTPPFALGCVEPLAVDARAPKALYVAVSGTGTASAQPYRLLVSRDDGQTWLDLPVPAF
jgi:hypothetical protein